ncbi:hypothetical protein PRNP1_000496 [Phytophthora ramorum]
MSLKLYAEIPYKLVRKRSHGPVLSTPPPLPLIALSPDDEWEEFDTPTQTGFGYALPYLSALDEAEAHQHAERGSIAVPPEVPRRSRMLSEYMTNNEFFQSPRHGFGLETRLVYKRNKELECGSTSLVGSLSRPEELSFSATFESGNLDRAYRVFGRRYAPSHELLVLRSSQSSSGAKPATRSSNESVVSPSSKGPSSQTSTTPFPFFVDVDFEYDLYADTDINTHGHIQWYFFRVTVPAILLRQTRERGAATLKVRFNIRNMLKKASLYTDGMLPTVYLESPAVIKCGWHHSGVNVCYFKNTDTYRHRRTGKVRNYYTLSFVHEFPVQVPSSPEAALSSSSQAHNAFDDKPLVAYFAHCYPYTYTRLQRFLLSLQKDPERRNNFKRRVMCKTIAGNNCDLLTITDFSQDDEKDLVTRRRTAIVLTARVHPGESNSSFVMHGILDFLTGNSLEARFLRHHFVFKVVPMLNPDGLPGTPARSKAEQDDGCSQQRILDTREPPLPVKSFVPLVSANDSTSTSNIRLAQLPRLSPNKQGVPVSWVQPQRPVSALLDPVSLNRPQENSRLLGLSSEFDQLFSGDDVSMLSLLDHDDLIREIEAALPDNFQDNPEEDSVGSESDPSGDTTEEEEKGEQQKVSPKDAKAPPIIDKQEPAKSVVPVPARNRPPRVTRHLSESRM